MKWTMKDIETMQAQGKIRGFNIPKAKEKKNQVGGRTVAKHFKKRSKEKDWIGWNLLYWCNERSLILEEEYRFNIERKWRFDWCIPALKIGIEYNGIMSEKSRHTTVGGYTGDMNKINSAQALGWKVLQFTPMNYKNLITELNSLKS
jgi:hypothetical protein